MAIYLKNWEISFYHFIEYTFLDFSLYFFYDHDS
jgi:hypothetical protein